MKTNEPSFDQIEDYTTNSLPEEEMREVERSILATGMAEAVFHTLIFDYRHRREYIDSLIGEDEEENENNSGLERQNSEKATLIDRDETLKTTRKMKHFEEMKLPANMEEIARWVETMQDELTQWKEQAEGEDFGAFARKLLAGRYAIAEVDAEEIARELIAGVEEFDRGFEQQRENGPDLRTTLEARIADLPEGERKNYLVNLLTALQAMEAADSDAESPAERIERLTRANEEKSCEELLDEILRDFASVEWIDRIVEAAAEGIDPEKIADLGSLLGADRRQQKLLTALALYAAQRDGKISLGPDASPRLTGAAAAAAVEMLHTTARLKNGEIDRKTWMKWMKTILGGLLAVALGLAGVLLSGYVGALIVVTLMSLFGQGIIATLLAFALTLPVVCLLADTTVKGVAWVLEVLDKPYDIVIEKIVRFVEACWQSVQTRLASKQESSERQETQPSERQEAQPAERSEVQRPNTHTETSDLDLA